MDTLLERGITRCFPEHEFIQRIVRRELLNPKHFEKHPKVDTLAFLAIKSKMHKEMMTDETDLNSKYTFKLIFRESIKDMTDFCEETPVWRDSNNLNEFLLFRVARGIMFSIMSMSRNLFHCLAKSVGYTDEICESESIRKAMISSQQSKKLDKDGRMEMKSGPDSRDAQRLRLRTDGYIIFSIISQEMPQFFLSQIQIIVTRKTLQIRIMGSYFAEIPHRNGLEYDTYWALKFTKMFMSKYAEWVVIKMNGEGLPVWLFNFLYMGYYLKKSIIDKLPRVIPSEGWEQYISNERPVYARWGDYIDDENNYIVHFTTRDNYNPNGKNYWGYLKI